VITESFQKNSKELSLMERLSIARHPSRPKGLEVIQAICSSFQELHGDRLYGDDAAIIGGVGTVCGRGVMILAQEKGEETKQKVERNFGMMLPDGYRKALRLMKLAEKFHLPVLSIIDTPGAYPGLDAEKRGQANAIASNLSEMSVLKTPILSLILGEGCSGGALGIGVCDKTLILEHAYFSVISPEGCAAILLNDSHKVDKMVKHLKMQSEDLLSFGVVDQVIPEGEGGFHENKRAVFEHIQREIESWIEAVQAIPVLDLIEERYKKYRSF
jgi:acetyl-CoA carboxylase carboxyl transferase subunit alpha